MQIRLRELTNAAFRVKPRMHAHSTAILDPSARIHPSCKIGPYCTIGANVELGENCERSGHRTPGRRGQVQCLGQRYETNPQMLQFL